MDDKLFRDWQYGKGDTGHTAGIPAPPNIEEEVLTFDPAEGTVPVISISRHRIGIDGKGVNTLITLHGCELNCKYCINPQCKDSYEGVARYSPESLYEAVKIDDAYFHETDGGITFSGGEPLLYSDFIQSFSLYVAKRWKIRIETSLSCDTDVFYDLYNIVDEWIIDIKTLNPLTYQAYTGGDFNKMKQFLNLMSQFSFIRKRCIIRIPIIPGYTTAEEVQEAKRQLSEMGFFRFDIFTYNLPDRKEMSEKEMSEEDNCDAHRNQISTKECQVGKMRCNFFRILRKKIAQKLGLKLSDTKCTYKGSCNGTCPECESELKILNNCLRQSQKNSK